MANVISLQNRRKRHGNNYCPEGRIQFPTVYRVTWPNEIAASCGSTRFYTLDRSQYGEGARFEEITRLDQNEPTSLIVKKHKNDEIAAAFAEAVAIFDPSQRGKGIFRTPDGIFTLSCIPTYRCWRSPLLIYLAEYPSRNILGFDVWTLGIDSDGARIEGDDVFFQGFSDIPDEITGDFWIEEPIRGQVTNPFATVAV